MVNMEPLAYTVSEAARLASVSRPTLYAWMKLPGFPVFRIGGCTRIPAGAFRTWLNEQADMGNLNSHGGV